MDAIRLAVKWQNPGRIQFQMQEAKEEDATGLATALEAALLTKSADVVRVLIEFKATCTSVRLDKLFDPEPDANLDKYQLFSKTLNDSNVAKLSRELCLKDENGQLLIETVQDSFLHCTSVKGRCSWGFAILIDLLDEHVSMEEGLDVRSMESNGVLEPNWVDLMMWAVLVGERELARQLWSQTADPLRAALMASLLCRQIRKTVFGGVGAEAGELEADADIYEDWAVGLIDQAELNTR